MGVDEKRKLIESKEMRDNVSREIKVREGL